MTDTKFVRRIIPSTLVIYCEDPVIAEGVIQGINYTLDMLQKNHCDIIMRKPPYVEFVEKPDSDPQDHVGVYKVRSRFAVASALEGKEGRRILTASSFYEEIIDHPFDIENNKGLNYD